MSESKVGLGGGPLGDDAVSDADAVRLIHAALELGVRVIDTAPSYGSSERRIGLALRDRRARATLVTKGGYGVPGVADWTAECIARGVDQALTTIGTDHLDAFVLHSCDRAVLARGDLFAPMLRAKEQGKVRAIGYSGDGDALDWAVRCEAFDLVECSLNPFDQRALRDAIPEARRRGLQVLAKRTLGNAPWTARERPARFDAGLYWDRMRAMFPDDGVAPTAELATRFVAHAPGVTAALVGTRAIAHLRAAVDAAALGPLPEAEEAPLRERFGKLGADWAGIVLRGARRRTWSTGADA